MVPDDAAVTDLPTAAAGSARIRVRFFAGAAEAAGTDDIELPARPGLLLDDILQQLPGALHASGLSTSEEGLSRVCRACSFLVNGQRARRDAVLRPGDQLDVLPPFAGG